jgi:intracellular septation protein
MVSENQPEAEKPAGPDLNQLLIDLGPVAIFVVAYNVLNRTMPGEGIFWATGIFIVATLAAIAWCKWKRGKIPPVLIVTGVLVTGFGGLTLIMHDEEFMKIKPTFMYLFYTTAIFGSVLFRVNVWKLLFGHVFILPDRIWTILALRWAGLFAFLAVLNEVIRQNMSTDFWVNSRILIFFPLILGFALLNTPLTLKHMGKEGSGTDELNKTPPG